MNSDKAAYFFLDRQPRWVQRQRFVRLWSDQKNLTVGNRGGHVPQCPIAGDANNSEANVQSIRIPVLMH